MTTPTWMRTVPFSHQRHALARAEAHPAFALLMEQGTGKSKVALDRGQQLAAAGQLDLILIVAPNGVHRNWIDDQVPLHVGLPYCAAVWGSAMRKSQQEQLERTMAFPGLKIIALNVEAFSLQKAPLFTANLLRRFRTLLLVDESSMIKHISSKRTKTLIKLGRLAAFRMILSGTPVTQGPLDLYSQFQFLGPGHLGFNSFTAFKAHYAEWRQRSLGGRNFQELVRYRNLDELKRLAGALSFSVRKDDCLDLPEKQYVLRGIEMAPEQRRIYNSVKTQILTQLSAGNLTVAHALTRLTRLSQITGGFVQADDGDAVTPLPDNPKREALKALLEDLPSHEKVIIWARFIPELRMIAAMLPGAAHWWGEIDDGSRAEGKRRFQEDADCRYFIGNPKSAGYGLTLTAASHVVYYSNDFSLEARLQSEDRAHRIGQHKTVVYTDLVVNDSLDRRVLAILSSKRDMATVFSTVGSIKELLDE